jgi:hypothetical protein
MRYRRIGTALKVCSIALACGFASVVGICWETGVWTPHQYQLFQLMSAECHPVWRDLWHGRIKAGDDLKRVMILTCPPRVDSYGRFTKLGYQPRHVGAFTGVTIIARDGRLISASAWSCTWRVSFFDGMSENDWREYEDAYDAHMRPFREARARQPFFDSTVLLGLMAAPSGAGHVVATAGLIGEI